MYESETLSFTHFPSLLNSSIPVIHIHEMYKNVREDKTSVCNIVLMDMSFPIEFPTYTYNNV